MRQYAEALRPAAEKVPPPPVAKEPEPMHGPSCVCEDCFTEKMRRN